MTLSLISHRDCTAHTASSTSNAGLIWHRFLRPRRNGEEGDQARLNEFCNWSRAFARTLAEEGPEGSSVLTSLTARRTKAIESAYPFHLLDPPTRFRTEGRLAVGLGNPAPVENAGLTLHHTYGFPVIHAASLRGVTRRYLIEACGGFDCVDTHHGRTLVLLLDRPVDGALLFDDPTIKEVEQFFDLVRRSVAGPADCTTCTIGQLDSFLFGDQGREASVVFFDGWPVDSHGNGWFEVDVLAPHHTRYYANKVAVASDTEGASINAFVAVRRDVVFEAPLAVTNRLAGLEKYLQQHCLLAVERLMADALDDHGIGARTGAGYGRMTPYDQQ